MTMHDDGSIPTRQSLLERLKDWRNQEDWRVFFDSYWRLIHATALKAGLEEAEAQEVVQEVMIAAAKKLPEFRYESGKDSLKGWLLSVTRWKVTDQWRKRGRAGRFTTAACAAGGHPGHPVGLEIGGDGPRTATVERVADPGGDELDRLWDTEWRDHLLQAALDRVKGHVNPAHYEIYHLHVVQGHSPRETARVLGVNVAQVYLAKLRVGRQLREEIRRLERGGG